MSLRTKLRTVSARNALKLALLCIGLFILARQLYYIYRTIEILIIVSMLEEPLIADNIDRVSVKNSRGDTVKAETEFLPSGSDPDPTVIRLKRAHHWLSTTLVKAESYGRDYHIEWRDDNTLEITLVFGCLVRLKTSVTTVGPIHISYRLTDGDQTLGSCPPGTIPRSETLPQRVPESR